jgi:galactitol-specific phosphotransferase system IIC component
VEFNSQDQAVAVVELVLVTLSEMVVLVLVVDVLLDGVQNNSQMLQAYQEQCITTKQMVIGILILLVVGQLRFKIQHKY